MQLRSDSLHDSLKNVVSTMTSIEDVIHEKLDQLIMVHAGNLTQNTLSILDEANEGTLVFSRVICIGNGILCMVNSSKNLFNIFNKYTRRGHSIITLSQKNQNLDPLYPLLFTSILVIPLPPTFKTLHQPTPTPNKNSKLCGFIVS